MDYGLIGLIDLWSIQIPVPVALAAVALIGYLFGQRTRQLMETQPDHARREMKRAQCVAKELEKIAESVRKDLASHRASVSKFKDRVRDLSANENEASWRELCKEAENMLKPTLKLAMQISLAYDEIRQQSTQLMAFTEVRTDPLTGVSNRRALDETLENMFAMLERYDSSFSLAIFDIDHFKQINDHRGHLHGDRTLQKFARLLDDSVRDTDMVARYGGEEFVVIMPHTSLEGACIFGDRLRGIIDANLPLTISGGLAQAEPKDSPQTLLSRADSALYSAKAAGRNRVYYHDTRQILPAAKPSKKADREDSIRTAAPDQAAPAEDLSTSTA